MVDSLSKPSNPAANNQPPDSGISPLPDSPPPQDVKVDPIPLPSVPMENPIIRPPQPLSPPPPPPPPAGAKHSRFPKPVIAGISALVFLLVALGSGLYLVGKQGVGEIRKQAGDVPDGSSSGCCSNDAQCQTWFGAAFTCSLANGACQSTFQCTAGPVPGNECETDQNCVDSHGGDSSWVCQGQEGQKRCQQTSGEVCPGGTCNAFIGFKCDSLVFKDGGLQCLDNPRDFGTDEAGARNYAAGCGQTDKVCTDGNNHRQLCGGFTVYSSSCGGGQETATPTPPPGATATPTPRPTATPTPGATATPTSAVSAQCVDMTLQFSTAAGGWRNATGGEIPSPGQRVRFLATGSLTTGSFTRGAFYVNGVLHTDDVVKVDDTHFGLEYTTSAAGGNLSVGAVLFHSSQGWVD